MAVKRRGWLGYRNGSAEPPKWAGEVRSWCVVHDAVDISQLEGFDLVVVTEPQRALDTWLGVDQREHLSTRAIRVVAHVPMMRPTESVLARWDWMSDAASRIRSGAGELWDGVYLDDMAEVLALPDGRPAAIELIALAREASRGGIVIIQTVADDVVTGAADLVGVESPLV